MVALLIIGYSLKLLEMHKRSDALLVIYLAYFIAASALLFHQTIPMAAYVTVVIILITTALTGLNQSRGYLKPIKSFQATGLLIVQSIPLMLLLFIVMPRLGPIWQVPMQQSAAKTGVSDSMSPGDFSKLGKSGELAFRVTFNGAIPAQSQLYWRGMVFSSFDGRRWTMSDPGDYFRTGRIVRWRGQSRQPWEDLIERRGNITEYDIVLEPTQQIWLYALPTPVSQTAGTGLTQDYNLVTKQPVQTRFKYSVSSYLDYRTQAAALPPWRFQNETQLPVNYNPETIALAQRWRQEANNDEAYIQRILTWINSEFIYTLEPPLLGEHSVDEFLFGTKRGFCEHFASSFAVMMRAAGIPARVVVGYQGGEVNPYQNYLLVHQFDAHAWTEVWLQGKGWVRVDPTAAVAPARIEQGFQDNFSQSQAFLENSPLSLIRFHKIGWINTLRYQWDRVNYSWHRLVLGYDPSVQSDLLTKLLGNTDPLRIAGFLILMSTLILAFIALRLRIRSDKRPVPVGIKAYRVFCTKLGRLGIERNKGETPLAFAERVSLLRPDLKDEAQTIKRLFEQAIYQKEQTNLEELMVAVAKFTPRKKREVIE
jgi:transglutaminase-like putative cysteine protease